MSVKIGDKVLSSSEYSYLLGLGLSGKGDMAKRYIESRAYKPMKGTIPEVGVYAKRPVKPESVVPVPQGTYTPGGGGRWTYYSGADAWVDNQTKKTMTPEEYEKTFPNQLRQANYRELYK